MRKRNVKSLVGILTIVCVTLAFTALPLQATPLRPVACAVKNNISATQQILAQQQYKEMQIRHVKLMDAVRRLTPYVRRSNDGTFVLTVPNQLKVDSGILKQIESGMEGINSLIRQGKLKSKKDLTVYDPNDKSYSTQGNVNATYTYWWGYEVYADSTTTNQLIAQINYATALVGILGTIPGVSSWLAGIVAGGLAYYSYELSEANASGEGVIVDVMYDSTTYSWMVTSINSQTA